MGSQFAHIKVLVWDLDGTLYQPNSAMIEDRLQSAYTVIMKHTGWSLAKTGEEFAKVYNIKTPSVTKASALLAHISLTESAYENELYKDRRKYLGHDEKLVKMFAQLKGFTHYMLVNGIQEKTVEALDVLGVTKNTFVEIVTSEIVGENKPGEKGFRYILDKTRLPVEQHLMIGDRVEVDLLPAKKLGMKTCLVWSNDERADISLPTVYEVADLLL